MKSSNRVPECEEFVSRNSVVLRFGPLCYRIVGHGVWGARTVEQLQGEFGEAGKADSPQFTLHAVRHPWSADLGQYVISGSLPPALASVLERPFPPSGWRIAGNDLVGGLWRHAAHTEALWTCLGPSGATPVLALPWCFFVEDIARLSGALAHAALVECDGAGFLLAAEPGGGKTTAAARLPATWGLLADDAALLWPDGTGGFLASPLPTWGHVVLGNPVPPALKQWRIETETRVCGVCLLKKADRLKISSVQPLEAARAMFVRFLEHPAMHEYRVPFAGQVFRTACSAARTVPTWRLELDTASAFWDQLRNKAIGHAR